MWERVREVERETGREFGEVVHELRLQGRPEEIPGRLGVSKFFLYQNFGWAMDKIAYVERKYGMPLGEAVVLRRAQGSTMQAIAKEWGLVVTTLYNALRRNQIAATGTQLEKES